MRKNIRWTSVLVTCTAVLVTGLFETNYYNKVYPGITLNGVGVAGLRADEIIQKWQPRVDNMQTWVLTWGTNQWGFTADQLGVKYDLAASARGPWSIGRSDKFWKNWQQKWDGFTRGINFELAYNVDEEKFQEVLDLLASQIEVPAKEPEITLNKTAKLIEVSPGENGWQIDRTGLENKLRTAVRALNNERIEIPVIQLTPKLSGSEVEKVKERGQNIIDKKLVLTLPETGQKWEINDEQIMVWLNGREEKWRKDKIAEWVNQLAQTVDRLAEDASFKFVEPGRVEEFRPGKDGLKVRQTALSVGIEEELNELERGTAASEVIVEVEKTKPTVGTGAVNNFGINEIVGTGESWFSGSITNRIFNLRKAAEKLNGVLIPPGEIFSFNQAVGEVSANTGYKQAYIIKEGKTILGDGGGVCQVSTTLFRAVLAAGLPIEERVAHAYRVRYYEEKYQVGFDATVFQPSPDFKFKNDTPAYILIQTDFSEKDKHLAFKLYGTSDGRVVEISKSRIWELTPPPPDLYIDDPTLPAGKVVQTEHAAYGAKVVFDWKVIRGDEVLQDRKFYSNYRAWQAVYLRGTKAN